VVVPRVGLEKLWPHLRKEELKMNGNAMIDACGAAIGLKAVTTNTVPSRIQILALMNIAIYEVALENLRGVYTLYEVEATVTNGTAPTDSFIFPPLAVLGTDNLVNALYVPPEEFWDYLNEAGDAAKPAYTIGDSGKFFISDGSATFSVMYVETPGQYTDAASAPDPNIPAHYDGHVIKKVLRMLLLAEGMPEGLQAIEKDRR